MKRILTIILALTLAFALSISAFAYAPDIKVVTATGTTSTVTVSGTTANGVLAVMAEILDSSKKSVAMKSFAVENNTFSGDFSNLSLTAGATYVVRAANYDGGSWMTTTFTVPATPPAPIEPPAEETPWENPFADVEKGAWYYDDVAFVSKNCLFEGTSVNTFATGTPMSRAMLVTVLWRMEGKPIPAGATPFSDVSNGKWYTEAVIWAAANKIVGGYGNGTFGPNDSITREQLVAILYRYAMYKGYDVRVGEDTNILSYNDAFNVSEYAIPAMQWACGAGLIHGDGGKLMPQGNAERCQVAAILHRFCEIQG